MQPYSPRWHGIILIFIVLNLVEGVCERDVVDVPANVVNSSVSCGYFAAMGERLTP